MRKLTHEEIIARQKELKNQNHIPLVVILNHIRSLYNVGSIFRTADGAGIEKLILGGITGHPPNNQISKTALGAENNVPWEHTWDIIPIIQDYKNKGYEVVFLEQIEGSISYQDYLPEKPTVLLLGNEIEGISDGILSLCDQPIEIEMSGLKNSLNVSVAFGIIAYHFRNHYLKS